MDRYEISSYPIWYGIYFIIFIAVLGVLAYVGNFLQNIISSFSFSLFKPLTMNYEPFKDSSDLSSTIKKVQTITSNLRKALDTFNTATDDTCSVIKGIEAKYLDNATAPSGDQDPPPTKAEAKELRAKAMPRAEKQWKQEKQDWSATHGQVGILECFEDESLYALVGANRELQDLLASAPVQRVTSQIKQIQTSAQFTQSYIDKLVTQLQPPEGFDNPTPEPTIEDTLAISKKLLANAQTIITQIQSILSTVKDLKTNYTIMNQKSNDPNTVQNISSSKS